MRMHSARRRSSRLTVSVVARRGGPSPSDRRPRSWPTQGRPTVAPRARIAAHGARRALAAAPTAPLLLLSASLHRHSS
eukprot:3475335-Pleurochrysis_carterae.AAC.1